MRRSVLRYPVATRQRPGHQHHQSPSFPFERHPLQRGLHRPPRLQPHYIFEKSRRRPTRVAAAADPDRVVTLVETCTSFPMRSGRLCKRVKRFMQTCRCTHASGRATRSPACELTGDNDGSGRAIPPLPNIDHLEFRPGGRGQGGRADLITAASG